MFVETWKINHRAARACHFNVCFFYFPRRASIQRKHNRWIFYNHCLQNTKVYMNSGHQGFVLAEGSTILASTGYKSHADLLHIINDLPVETGREISYFIGGVWMGKNGERTNKKTTIQLRQNRQSSASDPCVFEVLHLVISCS